MRFPWANTLLLALLASQVATGFFGLLSGSADRWWVLWLHGAGAYGIVLLLFWKGGVVLRSLRRQRRALVSRLVFLGMLDLLLAVLLTGGLWSFGGRRLVFGYSLITAHIILAVILLAPLTWHVLHMRFVFRVREATDRRALLRLGGLAVAGAALVLAAGRAMELFNLPGRARRFTGSYETGSYSGTFPYVSWLFDNPTPVPREVWRLIVDGAVERPLVLTYRQLSGMESGWQDAPLDCTGGWWSVQEWRGVPVPALLDAAGVRPSARSLEFVSVTGYSRRFPLSAAGSQLLALEVAGRTLDHGHGFPVRLVAPDYRGFNWVKWVVRLTVHETSELFQPPLPLR